ncbi:hypothetical protein [Blastopirellula marina]|uniref:Uncharacterized protein n=1 Tax=Blastopirellula marina DSM 3645 TaxID=314230 RepID=A3ZR69_9BACT|nr:hypothetical protein [Blastopirellula marina]EAQ81165.1 hypothetical protein DSM3645_21377 [Blastopirellula marina DSM 3645]
MGAEKGPLINGEAITKARFEHGFRTRNAFIAHLQTEGIELSRDVVGRYETSLDGRRHRGSFEKLAIYERIFGQPVEDFVVGENGVGIEASQLKIRDCSGHWETSGEDIVVPGHFDYPNGVKKHTAKIELRLEGNRVVGEGYDHDFDKVAIEGRVQEGGNHLAGTYEIQNDRMRIYGSVHLEYLACGKRMRGFYLGRETGHGVSFILGRLELSLMDYQAKGSK